MKYKATTICGCKLSNNLKIIPCDYHKKALPLYDALNYKREYNHIITTLKSLNNI